MNTRRHFQKRRSEGDDANSNWRTTLGILKNKVQTFVEQLDPHSEREEDALFPMMAKYIGRDVGPIAVMEYEHDQAKQNLKKFQEEISKEDLISIDFDQAKRLAAYAQLAHEILSEHFMKEENVLFPMAENMLSPDEKEQLNQMFNKS